MLSLMRKGIEKYKLIKNGDKIAVGISGGKDSLTLLKLLAEFRRFSPQKFELVAITVDLSFTGLSSIDTGIYIFKELLFKIFFSFTYFLIFILFLFYFLSCFDVPHKESRIWFLTKTSHQCGAIEGHHGPWEMRMLSVDHNCQGRPREKCRIWNNSWKKRSFQVE